MVVELDETLGWNADTLPTWGGEPIPFQDMASAERQIAEWTKQKTELGRPVRPMRVVPYESWYEPD